MSEFEIKCGKCGSCYNSRVAQQIIPDKNSTAGGTTKEIKDASCPVCGFSGILENSNIKRVVLFD